MHISLSATISIAASTFVTALLCTPVHATAETIRIGGTGSSIPLIQKIAELYREKDPAVQFSIVNPPLGSSGGMRALAAGKLDIAIICRPPTKEEQISFAKPVHWVTTPFVFVGRDTKPGFNLSRAQLADIYALKLKQWPDGRPIRLVLRSANDTDSILLRALSPQMDEAVTQTLQKNTLPVAENDLDNLQMIETTPGSIGAVSLGLLRASGSALHPIGLDRMQPGVQAMQEGRYPYAKKLMLLTARQPDATTRAFMQFLQSSEALSLLRGWDYVPAHP